MFIKLVDAHPMAIAGGRSLIAFLVILTFHRPRFTWSRPQIGAAVANAATMILFVSANKLTTSANAILLQYAAPVYVAVLAVLFLGEKLRLRDLLALGGVMAGIVVFFFDQLAPGELLGNLLAIASGLTFAGFFILMRAQKDGSPTESILLSHGIVALASLPFWGSFVPSAGNLLGIGALGIFQLGLAALCFSYGIKRVPALAAILLTMLEPLLNPVWVALFGGELPSLLALGGGGVILASVTTLQIVEARSKLRMVEAEA